MNNNRILITDDEPEICRLVQEILEDEDYIVTTAANAEEARIARIEFNPDLVLLDIRMPDGTGFNVLKRVNKLNFHFIFIARYF